MSWIDQLTSPLTIVTGSGTSFEVLWKPESKGLEWNYAEFDFNDIDGSLVKRSRLKGRKFPIKFYFQGEDHLDVAAAFEEATKDTRAWTIKHPYYGSILVHPTSLNFDNTEYNITEVTGTVIETIDEDATSFTPDPIDVITAQKFKLDETFINGFDVTPNTDNINSMLSTNDMLYAKGKKLNVSDTYFNTFRDAQKAILTATAGPLAAMRKVQAMINAPALFVQGVRDRIGSFQDQFNSLRLTIAGITGKAPRRIYENQGGAMLSAMCLCSANPQPNDYKNKVSITIIIDIIINNYNFYIEDLDSLQSNDNGDPDSYIPDADSLKNLTNLINFTVSNLINIALGAKQERSIILENDSNWILLAHRFYGLEIDDSTIQELMDNNQVGLNEILEVKKGRTILYYV